MANENSNGLGLFRYAAGFTIGRLFAAPADEVETRPRVRPCHHDRLELNELGDAYCTDCGEDMM